MNSQSGFDKLPIELCCLVADSIDEKSLAVLAVLSKRNYATFLPLLYRRVERDNLATLAISQKSRAPVKGQHPASFVKELSLEFEAIDLDEDQSEEQMRRELKKFRRDLGHAMDNIIEHSPNGSSPILQSFSFICEFLSFPEAFGKVDFSVFRALRRVHIACDFPKANIKKCLSMMKAICGPSLTSLELDLGFLEDVAPLEPRHFARILKQIGDTCPNLTELDISIPDAEENSIQAVNDALNSLRFPDLCSLHLNYGGCFEEPGGKELDWNQFLRNHPNVKRFYCNSPAHYIPIDALPCIEMYDGLFEYRSVLSNLTRRAFTSITLAILRAPENDEWTEFAKCLAQIPTLRRLAFEETYWHDRWRNHGLRLEGLVCITEACPNLTFLECEISLSLPLHRTWDTLFKALPGLEHLRLTIYVLELQSFFNDWTDNTRCIKQMVDFVELSLSYYPPQRSLRTIDLDVYGWKCCSYCREEPDWNEELRFDVTDNPDGKRRPCYVPEESLHV